MYSESNSFGFNLFIGIYTHITSLNSLPIRLKKAYSKG